LDVKLLTASEKDRGWETFLLDYKVSDLTPLSTIFTEEVMNNYSKIFSFMLKLKKIQHSLSISWGITMQNQKQFRRLNADLQSKFHRFNLAHHEMAHFVSNIHNYILVEVLESAWTVFLDGLH
jgi:gamma-tubulin complex component 3